MLRLQRNYLTKYNLKRDLKKILALPVSEEEKQRLLDERVIIKKQIAAKYQRKYASSKNGFDHIKQKQKEVCERNLNKIYEKMGGGCSICGATHDLHLAHRDPLTKIDNVAKMCYLPSFWENVMCLAELTKVELLCRSHHTLYDRSWHRLCNLPQTDEDYLKYVHYVTDWERETNKTISFVKYLKLKGVS